jgi:membrane associated rhomboid family serine protease
MNVHDHQPLLLGETLDYSFKQHDLDARFEQLRIEDASCREQPKLQRRSWFMLIISIVQIGVFLAELVANWSWTGSPMINLSRNPFFGPDIFVLIRLGAGFTPCMHTIPSITGNTSLKFSCFDHSKTSNDAKCTLQELCGFSSVSVTPNQWYRFVMPIFLHAGVTHLIINILTQQLVGNAIEKRIGCLRLAVIYFVSGIFGLVLGSNFAPEGMARIGCSGSVFALVAVGHLDLLYNWTEKKHPGYELMLIVLTTTVDLSLGLLPFIDNFSHVGGFFMGFVLTLALLGAPKNSRRIVRANRSYTQRRFGGYFFDRSKRWWLWWTVRLTMLITALVIFLILTINFYHRTIHCSWCRYISCLPIKNWCDYGQLSTLIKT